MIIIEDCMCLYSNQNIALLIITKVETQRDEQNLYMLLRNR